MFHFDYKMYWNLIDNFVLLPDAIFVKYGMDVNGDIMDVFDGPIVTKNGKTLTTEYPERGWHLLPRLDYAIILKAFILNPDIIDDGVKDVNYLGYIVCYDKKWCRNTSTN